MEGILVLLALLLFIGAVCGIVAVVKVSSLRSEVQALRRELAELGSTLPSPGEGAAREEPTPAPSVSEAVALDGSSPGTAGRRERPVARSAEPNPIVEKLIQNLQTHWMIWLGGLCVALAGIFLVRYSIEQGLLGPAGRIIAGLMVGGSLHGAAEWLRRRTGAVHPAFAAMAGAASITLYATLFAALRLYELIEPGVAFGGMALVALATMAMAYIHGPVLAAFGILGAYLVPILVSSGGGQVVIALIYVLIVSASALALLRYVYRPWLWWGFVAGALGWWLITLDTNGANAFRPWYLAILLYLVAAVPDLDYLLKKVVSLTDEDYRLDTLRRLEPVMARHLVMFVALVVGALGLSILADPTYHWPWFTLPILLLTLLLARTRESLYWAPWSVLLVTGIGWLGARLEHRDDLWLIQQLMPEVHSTFVIYLGVTVALSSAFALWYFSTNRFKPVWASLAALGPFLAMALGYLLTAYPEPSWRWGLVSLLFAFAALGVATGVRQREDTGALVVWLFVAGHFGLGLGAAMLLAEWTLTLAIAVQLISVAFIIRRFDLPQLDWLLKLVTGMVVLRLTLNPWLLDYPAAVHWPLWTYGGSTLCAIAAMRLLHTYPAIARWTEAAALHLAVLTIWAELRYLLYEGAVFESEFTFTEAAINIALFGSLSLVYHRRSLVSASLKPLYVIFSWLLLAVSAGSYLVIALRTAISDVWVWGAVGQTPLINPLLAAYGVPVVLAVLFARYHDSAWRRYWLGGAGFFTFVFLSVQIRHLWTGTIRYDQPATSPAELYSYSAVWLLLAVAAILGGTWRFGQEVYRAGMLLLAVVIAKLFLVDMSDLEGLLRVASFMGLGLSLLAISFLHQRLKETNPV